MVFVCGFTCVRLGAIIPAYQSLFFKTRNIDPYRALNCLGLI